MPRNRKPSSADSAGRVAPAALSLDAVVAFVLQHVRVKTNVCSRQIHEHGYTLERRTLSDYNFIYTTRGRLVWVMDGQEVELEPYRLLLVPPGLAHSGFSRTRQISFVSVHVEPILPGNQDAFALLRPARTRDLPPGCPLDRYLRGAMAEFDRGSSSDEHLMLRSWGRLATLELFRHDAAHGLLTHAVADPLIAAVLTELQARLDRPTRLDDLAHLTGYSAQHLNRLFQRILGVTPLQHLTHLRMRKAADLLAEGRLKIAAIAAQVGFDDPFYFSRVFREHLGLSPAAWRESVGSDSPDAGSGDLFSA
jgi:AraC-like DNA-binding protein